MDVEGRVRAYYDANSTAFAALGQGGTTMHRAVFGPRVTTREEAFRYVDELLLGELRAVNHPVRRVLDVGCGLGATTLHLAKRTSAEFVGVTLSPVQVRLARVAIARAGLARRATCIEASFTRLPAAVGQVDFAYAIESFIHSPSADAFFAGVAPHLVRGGRLAICDDFLTERGGAASGADEAQLQAFRDGWLAVSLVGRAALDAAASRAGLHPVAAHDLTPYLELRRPRDVAITWLLKLGRALPLPAERRRAWIGGDALQHALVDGLLEYRCVVFEKE